MKVDGGNGAVLGYEPADGQSESATEESGTEPTGGVAGASSTAR